MMTQLSLLNWMVLSTVLLGAWWLCYRLALRQERSFAYNRWFLVLGPLLAAGLPLLPVALPASWSAGPVPLAGVAAVLLPTVAIGPGEAPATALNWPQVLLLIYLAGAVFMLGRLALELGQLWLSTRRLAREKRPGYTLVPTHGQLPTSSFGRLIFWDETLALSPAEADQVLRHELAHAHQSHTFDRLLLELLRAGLWFNPFVHLCGRALALTHEYLADDAALRHAARQAPAFSPAQSYTHLLARQVANRLGFSVPLAHTFSHSQTLRRIAMIQKTSPIRRWKQWLALPLLSALLFTVACEKAATPAEPAAPSAAQDAALVPPPPPPPPTVVLHGHNEAPTLDKVYTYVEQMPQLPGGGGNRAIVEYLQSHINYSDALAANPKEGAVFASFTVMANGDVKDAAIVKGLSPAYDAAVLAAIQTLPRFVPGKQDGKAVAVSFTVPVRFVTNSSAKTVGLQLFNWYGGWSPKPASAGC
ncbi:M56 family metallopeptidase [Hymenobacter sp. M29]|uniref:M56 family metallopeptidase n=1 Tax=Hymenobacter mellowenesis TaxID=3063995 RepID=A0ABT9AG37_9BACT|nr:M56 family metallopeptidase [Hymenobacter sp. M29]MDO7848830.1 M56 family metallopeptidase [Hymenobacter sp. M29]